LTTDTSLLTAAGNDLGFEQVFARQIEALAKLGDLLIIHSTSGMSPNVIKAAEAAKALGVEVLAFLARDGGALKGLATHSVIIPTTRTDRAQELHLCIEHIICDMIDQTL
jgi:D-sedoheptulose 7-phosphate isomerase